MEAGTDLGPILPMAELHVFVPEVDVDLAIKVSDSMGKANDICWI